jgi:hypothetical protein
MININLPANIYGDGVNDDTDGIQSLLDSGASNVFLPKPSHHYLISRTLLIHSGQTLQLERTAVIKLADHAHAHMLTNADHDGGNSMITVIGGIWDGNNAYQTCDYHQGVDWHVSYDPERYLGILMQFNNVTDLRIANLTLKDPEAFGIQLGNLQRFTIEDITFDYNMLRLNMDGVHLNGNCRQGRIVNLKGATNDDMVALNADDGWMYEMSRGPIEDIQVDGLWAENGYTAVRMLSAGSPISRVRISNIYGSFRYFVTSFTNETAHPDEPSEISDIIIDGVFCSKPARPMANPLDSDDWGCHNRPFFWIEPKTRVLNLHLQNILRRERLENAPPTLFISENATIDHLAISNASIINEASTPLDFLVNEGTIGSLQMGNVYIKASIGDGKGNMLVDRGSIGEQTCCNCDADQNAG